MVVIIQNEQNHKRNFARFEHGKRAGDGIGKLTLNELQEMVTQTRKTREHWLRQYQDLMRGQSRSKCFTKNTKLNK
ncbi:hypothetical protein BSR03_19785 [Serratia proteamaculans]|nr:hypothetical protein BSR03_19785 [Serratia proteamaculans]